MDALPPILFLLAVAVVGYLFWKKSKKASKATGPASASRPDAFDFTRNPPRAPAGGYLTDTSKVPPKVPAQFGSSILGYFDLTPIDAPPIVVDASGNHSPTSEQSRRARHEGIVTCILGEGAWRHLLPLDIAGELGDRALAAMDEIGLESLDELESSADVMHIRAALKQAWGENVGGKVEGGLGVLGGYAPNAAALAKKQRDERRAKGQKIGLR